MNDPRVESHESVMKDATDPGVSRPCIGEETNPNPGEFNFSLIEQEVAETR
jgi:hypothetical protein